MFEVKPALQEACNTANPIQQSFRSQSFTIVACAMSFFVERGEHAPYNFDMAAELPAAITLSTPKQKFRWIMKSGWSGLCPRCGKGHMFKSWLKIVDRCGVCGLDYRFAAPDDGPAFFSLCFFALPPIAFLVWLQAAHDPPFWVHLVTSLPLLVLSCLLPLRPVKGWLVASQFVNRAQEAGTQGLWAQLHNSDTDRSEFDQ